MPRVVHGHDLPLWRPSAVSWMSRCDILDLLGRSHTPLWERVYSTDLMRRTSPARDVPSIVMPYSSYPLSPCVAGKPWVSIPPTVSDLQGKMIGADPARTVQGRTVNFTRVFQTRGSTGIGTQRATHALLSRSIGRDVPVPLPSTMHRSFFFTVRVHDQSKGETLWLTVHLRHRA